jgi:hypothetical protein
MSEEVPESERDQLLEKLGISLPKDEEFKELLKREGIGHLIRKDVQESFTPQEIGLINRNVDKILADLAESSSGLSGNERILTEVLKKQENDLEAFTIRDIDVDVREKGYAWKGTITVSMSAENWSKATKQVELITQLALMKLARTRGLVPKVNIHFKKKKTPTGKTRFNLAEAAQEIELFAKKLLGDDFIMVKKRLQKRFSSKDDLTDACSEVQRVVNLFIDEDLARKFKNEVTDILYRTEGD